MLLSQSAEYALRMMAYLAIIEGNCPQRAKDISDQANIPAFYSSKILRCMVTAGLLNAGKGHGGGFSLAKSPGRIKFIHIFEAIEGQIEPRYCVFGIGRCNSSNPCPLHQRWSELNKAFQVWARKTTLADVRKDTSKLKSPFCRNLCKFD